jgi:hypothetical protein
MLLRRVAKDMVLFLEVEISFAELEGLRAGDATIGAGFRFSS